MSDDRFHIKINGEEKSLEVGTDLAGVLRSLGVDPKSARGVAVAVNEVVVRRQEWKSRKLTEGDSVEIVTAMQGG